jgi:uncharacterized lipoprotein YmbA
MLNRASLILAIFCCVLSLATGCSVLDPQPDRTQFFVLSPLAEPAEGAGLQNAVVALGPVKLPDYLGRLEIATRTDENRLKFSDTDRWAEPLDVNFTRVLSQDLAILMNLGDIVSYPWFADTHVDYQIPVHVSRFEGQDEGDVVLQARWSGKAVKSGALLYAKDSRIVEKGGENGTVGAMNAAVTELAREIAGVLGQISPH